MRCPDCNKFVSQEPGDVEVVNEDVDSDGHVTIEVRIVQNCAECGTELKEATLTIERDFQAVEEGHDPEVPSYECDGKDVTEDTDYAKAVTVLLYALLTDLSDEEIVAEVDSTLSTFETEHNYEVEVNLDNDEWSKGKGRYCQRFYGVSGSIEVSCSCGARAEFEVTCCEAESDAYVAASGMDECC